MTASGGASQIDLAVVIVSWNNADIIANALRSLIDDLRDSGLRYEVWVVDSASDDQSAEIVGREFPTVRLIENKTNIGFAAANNLAMRKLGFGSDALPAEMPSAV